MYEGAPKNGYFIACSIAYANGFGGDQYQLLSIQPF